MKKRISLHAAALLFFATTGGVMLWRPLSRGLSLVPWQISYMLDNLYRGGAETVLKKYPNTSILFDVAFQFYPWADYSLSRLAAGSVPLWNPYSLAGLPFLANHQSGVFEFTKLFAYAFNLDAVQLPGFSWWLTIALGGFFTYMFLRELGLGFIAGIIGGTTFSLSGPMLAWLGWPHTSTAIWLPFILTAISKTLNGGRLYWVGMLAGGIAFLFFAGHIQIAWYVAFTAAAWTVARLWILVKERGLPNVWPRSLWLGAGGLLGLGLASIQLFPTLEFMGQSSTISAGRGLYASHNFIEAVTGGWWLAPHGFAGLARSLSSLMLLLYPGFFGDLFSQYAGIAGNYNESAVYVGIVGLSLAATGAVFPAGYRREARFWTVLALLSLGAALALPALGLINYLPIFKLTNMGRIRYIVAFSLSVLAAIGAQAILARKPRRAALPRPLLAFISVLIGLSGIAYAAIWLSGGRAKSLTMRMVSVESALLVAVVAAGIVIVVLLARGSPRAYISASACLALLVVAELLSYGVIYRGRIDSDLVGKDRPAITWIKKRVGINRVTSFKKTGPFTSLYPNSSILFKLQDIRGYEVLNVSRFEKLQGTVAGKDPRTTYRRFSPDYFDLLGVKYFIQSADDPERTRLKSPRFRLAHRAGQTLVFENRRALPRAFIAYKSRPVKTSGHALKLLKKENIDLGRLALIENGPALHGRRRVDPAKIVSYEPERVEIETKTGSRGLLVLTDAYYRGWQATVDGRKAKIYPADVAFRGVVVPRGSHRIVFAYRPDSYLKSFYLFWPSLAATLTLMGYGVAQYWLEKRGRRRAS